jgi:hypothetical protein
LKGRYKKRNKIKDYNNLDKRFFLYSQVLNRRKRRSAIVPAGYPNSQKRENDVSTGGGNRDWNYIY